MWLLAATGCRAGPTPIVIHVGIDGEHQSDLLVEALPYDRMAIMDSLTRLAERPRPTFPDLEDAMRAFRRQSVEDFAETHATWIEARAEVAALADSLNGLGRDAPGYARLYGRFRTAYRRLSSDEADLEADMRERFGDDRELARRAAAAADSLRDWERNAYALLPSLEARLMDILGRAPVVASTDEKGAAVMELAAGRWWITARRRHPLNPFLEYLWYVPVVTNGYLPFSVPLTEASVRLEWRH